MCQQKQISTFFLKYLFKCVIYNWVIQSRQIKRRVVATTPSVMQQCVVICLSDQLSHDCLPNLYTSFLFFFY